jgi:hypothetical protein
MFPVLDCACLEVHQTLVSDTPFVFQLKYERKEMKFKCNNKQERLEWMLVINKLQKDSEITRNNDNQRDNTRLTTMLTKA